MATVLLPNGIGAASGPALVTGRPLTTFGNVWYLGPGGVDGATLGRTRARPLATLAQAYGNAAAGDVIDILPNHVESPSATLVMAKAGVTIVAEGLGSARARFTWASAGSFVPMWTVQGACTRFINLVLPASTGTTPGPRLDVSGAGCLIEDCDLTVGPFDSAIGTVNYSAGHQIIRRTRFTLAAQGGALPIDVVAPITGLTLDNVTFDGGPFGWNTLRGEAFLSHAVVTGLYAVNVVLINGSGAQFTAGTTGVWVSGSVSGAPTVSGG